jgi:hypothetical protein
MTAKFVFDAPESAKLTRFREALEARGKSAEEIETLLPHFMARGEAENTAAAT